MIQNIINHKDAVSLLDQCISVSADIDEETVRTTAGIAGTCLLYTSTQLMTVAVLALQGAFAEHEKILSKLGADSFEIRQKKDLDRSFDRLIIPGGESTVQGLSLIHISITSCT